MIATGLLRLTRDIEIRQTPGGTELGELTGTWNYGTEKTDRGYLPSAFCKAALWGKRAQALAQYLTKGKTIVVTLGDIHPEAYQSKGELKALIKAKVLEVQLLPRPSDDAGEPRSGGGARQPSRQRNLDDGPAAF